jgi:hypothetical protein
MLSSSRRNGTQVAPSSAGGVRMTTGSLTKRVQILEQTVETLQQLPGGMAAVESQILQLQSEMRSDFSAIRTELREGNEETPREMREMHGELVTRIQEGDEETRSEMRAMHDELVTRIQEGDEETRKQMRVLHEDVVSRFALLQEGLRRRKR